MVLDPLVSVVTVNHDGGHLLGPLLESLEGQSYGNREILLVDNASTDDSLELVHRSFPRVRVVALGENLGFVGGNNAGIRAARGELVALINNDTVAEPEWLEGLVRTALEDPRIAAVGSKILFFRPFLPISLVVEPADSPELGADPESPPPGVLFGEDSEFVGCAYRKPIYKEGFGRPERLEGRRVRRTTARATLYLPIRTEDAARLRLVVGGGEAGRGRRLEVRVGSTRVAELDVEAALEEAVIDVPPDVLRAELFDVINNAGTHLEASGETADRGIYEPDRGQLDAAEDVPAICGAAVLLRRSALERVGLFDRDFFMYYEDTDLSWRLRMRGYRLRYQPRSVVRHLHAASSGEWSPLFTFLTARNKILMIAKNGGLGSFLRAYGREIRLLFALILRLRRAPRRSVEGSLGGELAIRLRVHRSLLKQIPRALLKRIGILAH